MKIEHYILSHRHAKTGGVSFQLEAIEQNKNEAIKWPHRMLYIVKDQDEFLYVGEAKAELKKRFDRGFVSYRSYKRTKKARNGYKGYKWIKLVDPEEGNPRNLDVYVVLFSKAYDEKRSLIEAVEGEVVWEVRNLTNKWPLYQNEIHFNNKFKEAHDIAKKILASKK